MTFDPVRICQVLNGEAVDYVIIGGLAAALRGSPLPTEGVDVLPARDAENLDRLARALNRLNARIRTDRESVQVRIAQRTYAACPTWSPCAMQIGPRSRVSVSGLRVRPVGQAVRAVQ